MPVYWLMMSIAATKGVYHMIRQPSYWEKTFHGLSAKPDEAWDTAVKEHDAEPAAAP